jgi:CheY-like chemotaxis protein
MVRSFERGRQVETTLGRRVTVAAVSASTHAEDRQRAIAAGFDHYLAKPVDPVALASTVKALVAIGNCTSPSRTDRRPASDHEESAGHD